MYVPKNDFGGSFQSPKVKGGKNCQILYGV
jgi:hypothetical protein